METGVNFRPAGGVRGQVAGSLPGRQPGTGTRRVRGGVPEVPGTRFSSPGRGLGIRQSMGWTKVCESHGRDFGCGHRHSGQLLSCKAACFPSRSGARWVVGRRWRLSRRRQFPRKVSFYVPVLSFFLGKILCYFYKGMDSYFCVLLSMPVAKREPTPCYRDANSVVLLSGLFGRKGGKYTVRPRFPLVWTSFSG